MDRDHHTAYFRLSVPRGEGIPFLEVRKLLTTTVKTVQSYLPLFASVIEKGVSAADALAQHPRSSAVIS
jgi:hypothetical protein